MAKNRITVILVQKRIRATALLLWSFEWTLGTKASTVHTFIAGTTKISNSLKWYMKFLVSKFCNYYWFTQGFKGFMWGDDLFKEGILLCFNQIQDLNMGKPVTHLIIIYFHKRCLHSWGDRWHFWRCLHLCAHSSAQFDAEVGWARGITHWWWLVIFWKSMHKMRNSDRAICMSMASCLPFWVMHTD